MTHRVLFEPWGVAVVELATDRRFTRLFARSQHFPAAE